MDEIRLTHAGRNAAQTFYFTASEIAAIIPNEGGSDIYLKGVPVPITVNESGEEILSVFDYNQRMRD